MNHFVKVFVILICFFGFFCFGGYQALTAEEKPKAEKGILDLRLWSFERDGNIDLSGEWEIYTNQLVSSEELKKGNQLPDGYVKLPGIWANHQLANTVFDSFGAHTYRLKILLSQMDAYLAFKVMDINTAYSIYVNGKNIGSVGVVGLSPESSKPRVLPQLFDFNLFSDELEIILHVSNYHDSFGGVRFPIIIGKEEKIHLAKEVSLIVEFFLFGSILMMGLYHFGIFLYRKTDRAFLYFCLFCTISAFRIVVTGERYFSFYFDNLSWSSLIKLENLSFLIVVPIFALFVESLFHKRYNSVVSRFLIVVAASLSIIQLFISVRSITPAIQIYEYITVLFLVYVVWVVMRAVFERQEGAVIFLSGFILIFLTAINDILYDQQIIFTGFWVPIGVFGMICSQAFFLSGRYAKTLTNLKSTSKELARKTSELKRKNIELKHHQYSLERTVLERTDSIKRLLDNTGQGFLSFGSDYIVESIYSKKCLGFFGKPIEGIDIRELLFDAFQFKDRRLLNDLLDLVFQKISTLETLNELLPKEANLDERILKTEFKFIDPRELDDQGKVLIILTDITQEKVLEEQIRLDQERKEKLIRIAGDQSGFISFVKELKNEFKKIRSELKKDSESIDFQKLIKILHTIKGNCSLYHLNRLVEYSHEMESIIEVCLNSEDKESIGELVTELYSKTGDMNKSLESCLIELNNIIPTEKLLSSENYFQVSESKLKSIENQLKQLVSLEKTSELDDVLSRFRNQPIARAFKDLANVAQKVAGEMSKSVSIGFSGMMTEIPFEKLKDLFSTLVHVMRNSVVHGLEPEDIRVMQGKNSTGSIKLSAGIEGDILQLIISDDGQGIDTEEVLTVAKSKGLIDMNRSDVMSEENILALIFFPGFSTTEDVTVYSGRGYGLAAVKEEVNMLGGDISVRSIPGKGTSFTISIPITKWMN